MNTDKARFQLHYWLAVDDLIKIARLKEKNFRENKTNESGLDFIKNALNQGAITEEIFNKILPAIENIDTPYELNIIDEILNNDK